MRGFWELTVKHSYSLSIKYSINGTETLKDSPHSYTKVPRSGKITIHNNNNTTRNEKLIGFAFF